MASLVKKHFLDFDFKQDDESFREFLEGLEEKCFRNFTDNINTDEDEKVYPRQVEKLLREKGSDNLQKEVVDLCLFYLIQSPNVPQKYFSELREAFERALEIIEENNIFQDLKDLDFLREKLRGLQEFVCDPGFPQSDDVFLLTNYTVKATLFVLKRDNPLEVYKDTLEFLKAVVISPNAPKYPDLIDKFRVMTDYITREKIKKDCRLFETWAPLVCAILELGPPLIETAKLLKSDMYEYMTYTKPQKSHDKLWLPILVLCVKWESHITMDAASRFMREDQWVRCLNWKENIKFAEQILQALIDIDFTKHEDREEFGDLTNSAQTLVDKLMDRISILKSKGKCDELIVELSFRLLENYEMFPKLFCLSREVVSHVSLKNNKELVGPYLDRFVNLMKDEKVPWDETSLHNVGSDLIDNLVDSVYESNQYNDKEVDQKIIGMILYCMEEGRELVCWQSGELNLFGAIATVVMAKFVLAKRERGALSDVKALMPSIQRLMSQHEDERVTEQCESILYLIGQQASQVLDSDGVGNLIDHYIEHPDVQIIVNLEAAYDSCPAAFVKRFDALMEVFAKDRQSNCFVLQCLLLKKMAEKQPEIFTPRSVEILFEVHYMDFTANSQVLLALDVLSLTRPELIHPFIPHPLLDHKLMQETMGSYHMNIITRVARQHQDCHKCVFEFFIARLRDSSDQHMLYGAIMGLREMLQICGPEMFKEEEMALIEKQQSTAPAKYVKDVAQDLLDEIAGRSLEKVSSDVNTQAGQIEKLEVGVAGTKVVLKKVHREVKEQGGEIRGVKEGLVEVNERVDVVEGDVEETKIKVEEIDKKTMSNAPIWSRDVTKLLNPESDHDWRLLASRLGYSPDDIRGWATQSDPCMALLSEWYATHKTMEASKAVLNALQEMNRVDAAIIVENAMKAAEGVVTDEPVDYPEPPEIFLSYQWGHQNEVKLICRHLEMAGYKCWMDVGQMGGGDKLFEKIDSGIRGAKVVISCVTEKYAKSPNCNREVNLTVNLCKPLIPLLMEKMAWPPSGSMGPIFSEYLFIRFFQRPGEETNDNRIWPAAKFTELLMQLNCLKVMPDEKIITKEYKNWWIPVVQEIKIPKKSQTKEKLAPQSNKPLERVTSPDIFLSYQWGKQKEISALFQRLTSLGFTCWMDIHQMGGGDSLFDKIDRGVRGCKVMLSSVTTKYALSANCRREVSLADALKKPIIPLLMEKIDWPPSGPMSMVLTSLLYVNFSKDESVQLSWDGKVFDDLMKKIQENIPEKESQESVTNAGVQGMDTKSNHKESKNDSGKVQTEEVTHGTLHDKVESGKPRSEQDGGGATKAEPTNAVTPRNDPPAKKSSTCTLL